MLAALMIVVAGLCILAGTWQISRYQQSVRDNNRLDDNAHAAAVALTTSLVPLVGSGPAPSREAIRFRTVTTTGRFLDGAAEFVRDQSLNGTSGYWVLNALRTQDGVLLVVRGFVADNGQGGPPPAVSPPPSGPVTIEGRLQTTTSKNDGASELTDGVLESINPTQQAARLDAPVFDTYATLIAGSPGTEGVTALPRPDLSNPAGGAYEPQHFAYIIQWYIFALLALAVPFAISRSEVRDAHRRFLGIDPDRREFGLDPVSEAEPRRSLGSGSAGGELARRDSGTVVPLGEATPEQWRQAEHLADRYGRSLGLGHHDAPGSASPAGKPRPPGRAPSERSYGVPVVNSSDRPHPSLDAYQGAYNDELWELALADGDLPIEKPEK
jgi:cytochrome oxidase assembly protein ShyY1